MKTRKTGWYFNDRKRNPYPTAELVATDCNATI